MLRKLLSATLIITIGLFTLGCGQTNTLADTAATPTIPPGNYSKATFAGGCFWCMEKPFDEIPGVVDTTSGYTGGTKENPTYRQVSGGGTGHTESVQVTYDPEKVKYDTLLKTFWRNIDPLDQYGQFCDKGSQYRSGIFYENDEQKQLAEASKAELAESGRFEKPIVTEVTQASKFYPAEDYHQNYYKTNSVKYKVYRFGCGRDQRLQELWGDEAGH
ncbi:peptide-methionine (S)-S-oxide reductase MsrA [filamentous cyanobacterium LEGE 11480]|uniref:Peptide methionine sulfoxide reductase MsrA n=1 Tax=Romeriopsis navalis LEGE 11480 TaxID=2777977 RepID=A0A928VL95_9CYAN|nr:peptide-methionine (S)-S-oxide reductase MsrA [Romeriopsis navalis]MBE9030390.1 peptide-methionine (S)-S-oxide reductase MsrA [Romeriopsis navalis LEGE 11480]